MGTPNNSAHDVPAVEFYPYDLFMSADPEEGRQAQQTGKIIFGIVAELRPILKYIAVPLPILDRYCFDGCAYPDSRHGNVGDLYTGRVRGVKLLEVWARRPDQEKFLFLQENGDFFVALLCSDRTKPEHYHEVVKDDHPGYVPITWSCAKFGDLIGAMKRVLTEATEKREQHLAALQQRSMVLDQLLAVINREQ